MTTPTSVISLSDVQAEFGGANPISLSEYYAGGGLVNNPPPTSIYQTGPVPTSGPISLGNFRGLQALAPAGAMLYATPGTYSFVVPAGYTTITSILVGGGGGGGGGIQSGDIHGGTGGGAGGIRYLQNIAVTPGETLTVVVGSGGLKGFTNVTTGSPNTGSVIAAAGTNTSILRGGSTILVASGGGGGQGSAGDNYNGTPGAAGAPNGVPGDVNWVQRNVFPPALGGNNGSSYGKGGNSNSTTGNAPTDGGNGLVWLAWGAGNSPPVNYDLHPSGNAQFMVRQQNSATFIVNPSLTFKAAGYTAFTATQNTDGARQIHLTPPWLRPTVAGFEGRQYWIYATVTSQTGAAQSVVGPLNTWVSLNSDVSWSKPCYEMVPSYDIDGNPTGGFEQAPANGVTLMTIYISTSASGSPIVATYTNVELSAYTTI